MRRSTFVAGLASCVVAYAWIPTPHNGPDAHEPPWTFNGAVDKIAFRGGLSIADASEGGGAVVVSAPPPPPTTTTAPPTTEGPVEVERVERQPNPRTLKALRDCESTDRYAIATGNGYYGAYQFDRTTWNGVAARHMPWLVGVSPHTASPEDQDAMAWWLWQERGTAPWPVCGPRSWRA